MQAPEKEVKADQVKERLYLILGTLHQPGGRAQNVCNMLRGLSLSYLQAGPLDLLG